MWRKLFTAPWPESQEPPEAVRTKAVQRMRDFWRARGWQLVLGEVFLWIAAVYRDVESAQSYGVLAGIIALAYVSGLVPIPFSVWLVNMVVLFMLQGMLVNGLGAVTALAFVVPYTFATLGLPGRTRVAVQAWCIVFFWGSLFYELVPLFARLDPPRVILVSYNILLAAFIFESLRILNNLAVQLNSEYVAEEVRGQSQRFLARVSHELRTPLNSVLGFAKLLRRGDLSESQQNYLYQIVDEGEQLNRLVSDLLDSAHLSTGKLTLTLADCDVNSICRTVADEQRPHLPEAVTLQTYLAADLPTLQVDAVRLRQAISNLVSNAVKHTTQGYITISTSIRKQRLCIAVQDTGKGISEAQQALIFVPFVQLDRSSAGVGLGLDIALQLVRLHGGTITLESAIGQGSTFTIELPLL